MTREEFEKLVEEEFPKAVPEKFHPLLKNVAFLVDTEAPDADLLGLYHGIPHTARGAHYGEGMTLPDTITLYQKTIEEHAREEVGRILQHKQHTNKLENVGVSYEEYLRKVIRETIWHEVAHYLGYDEDQVQEREHRRDNGIL
jgi:predicted Zn-dependent protease with MMP-like domain